MRVKEDQAATNSMRLRFCDTHFYKFFLSLKFLVILWMFLEFSANDWMKFRGKKWFSVEQELTTHFARIWLFSCMYSHMNNEFVFPSETFAANGACECLRRWIPGIRSFRDRAWSRRYVVRCAYRLIYRRRSRAWELLLSRARKYRHHTSTGTHRCRIVWWPGKISTISKSTKL